MSKFYLLLLAFASTCVIATESENATPASDAAISEEQAQQVVNYCADNEACAASMVESLVEQSTDSESSSTE